jgi:hypothetical protein
VNESVLRNKTISSIHKSSQGDFWIGTEGSGILHWNDKSGRVISYLPDAENKNSISHTNVKCLLPDQQKGLWIGTLNGLNYLDFRSNKFRQYFYRNDRSGFITDAYTLSYDHRGDLWIGMSRDGLCHFIIKESRFESYKNIQNDSTSLSSNFVTYVYEAPDRTLWVGTPAGLNKKLKDNKFQRYFIQQGVNSSTTEFYINCIFEDSKHRLWLGTLQNGFCLFNAITGESICYSTLDGLPSNTIRGIMEDNRGYLWLSTNNGLSRFDPEKKKFNNYNKYDGLICTEFRENSFCKSNNGIFYFGGYNGIVSFNPDSILENTTIPSVVFKKLFLFNEEVKIGATDNILSQPIDKTQVITLNHDQNIFSIEFAVLNFINPLKNQFAYKLEGFENNWNYVKEPIASYMNLEPGTYNLKIKGSNNDGVWNEEGASIKIIITPPFYATIAFRFMTVLLFIISLVVFYRWRVRNIRSYNIKLEKEVELKTKDVKIINSKLEENNRLLALNMNSLVQKNEELKSAFEKGKKLLVEKNELESINLMLK